ncbi:hypothetical protein DRY87_25690, partial [Salmonella enterica subsp. enterica serovar Newport]|nr:hypothetical protein [Salmonella enterica subsp. enterica serovar Newport]
MNAVEQYLETVRRHLAFDPELAERVVDEMRDHLVEASEHADSYHPSDPIRRMGDPYELAVSMAQATLSTRIRTTWRTLAIATVAVFLAMRLRVLAAPEVGYPDAWVAFADRIDGSAFLLAMAVAAAAWLLTRKPNSAAMDRSLCLLGATFALLGASALAGAAVLSSTLAFDRIAAVPLTAS